MKMPWARMMRVVLLLVGLVAQGELQASCSDFVLHLKDSAAGTAGASGRELDVFVNCHEGNYQYPAATTLQIYQFDESGRFCSSWKSCGNINHWKVDVGATVGYWVGESFNRISDRTRVQTVGDVLTFVDSHGTVASDSTERSIHVSAAIDFGEIRRFCSEVSVPVCW